MVAIQEDKIVNFIQSKKSQLETFLSANKSTGSSSACATLDALDILKGMVPLKYLSVPFLNCMKIDSTEIKIDLADDKLHESRRDKENRKENCVALPPSCKEESLTKSAEVPPLEDYFTPKGTATKNQQKSKSSIKQFFTKK